MKYRMCLIMTFMCLFITTIQAEMVDTYSYANKTLSFDGTTEIDTTTYTFKQELTYNSTIYNSNPVDMGYAHAAAGSTIAENANGGNGQAFSGRLIGLASGAGIQDDYNTLQTMIDAWSGPSIEITNLVKEESISTDGTSFTNNYLTIDSAGQYGTFETPHENAVMNFYTVKAGNEFALYFLEPAISEGYWSTRHLAYIGDKTIREISHFSASVVPAPAAFLLGLLGLGMAGVKLRKKV